MQLPYFYISKDHKRRAQTGETEVSSRQDGKLTIKTGEKVYITQILSL